jgi:O-antigen/teichoic acid export membrane protein
MSIIKKIKSHSSIFVFADQMIFSGTNFLTTFFLAQKLVVSSFGLFSSIVIISYLAMSITNALVIQPFQVSVVRVLNKEDYFRFLFSVLLVLVLFFGLILKLSVYLVPSLTVFKLDNNAIICFVTGLLIQDFFRKILLGTGKIYTAFSIDCLFLLLVLISFYLFEINLISVLWIFGIANLASSLLGIGIFFRNYKKINSWNSYFVDHINQGKWLFSVSLLQWCSSNFFILVSGIYLGIEALGALRLVQSFFGVINVVLQTVENYFIPKVASIYNDSVVDAKKFLMNITLIGAVLFGLFLSVFFLFSKEIITLAGGAKYEKYSYVVQIVSVLYFFIFMSYPIRIAVRVLVLNKIFFVGYLLSFLLSIGTFHFLLKYLGLYGAVTGLIMNQVIMILYWQYQLRKNHFQLWK